MSLDFYIPKMAKAVLRGKFIMLNTYIRKVGRRKIGKIFLAIQKDIQDTLLNGKSKMQMVYIVC